MQKKPPTPSTNPIPSASVRSHRTARLLSTTLVFGAVGPWALAQQQTANTPAVTINSTEPVSKPASFEPGRLERIKALGNPMLKGSIPTYYTPGYKARARKLQTFFTNELRFAQRRIEFNLTVSLAVLDRTEIECRLGSGRNRQSSAGTISSLPARTHVMALFPASVFIERSGTRWRYAPASPAGTSPINIAATSWPRVAVPRPSRRSSARKRILARMACGAMPAIAWSAGPPSANATAVLASTQMTARTIERAGKIRIGVTMLFFSM